MTRTACTICIMAAALSACQAPQIGGPTAPRGDSNAGVLTLPSGHSVGVYPDELAYTGNAMYRWPDGRQYDGDWVSGLPQGIGTEQLPGGEVYRGTWQAGVRHGHGELKRPDGSRYVGDFRDGAREGEGAEHTSGGLYRGTWRNDAPEGAGEYFDNSGASYKGGWQSGQRFGFGSYEDGRGNRYEGDWVNDSPTGFGLMASADGTRYEGSWVRNQRQGYGRIEAPTGFIYEGTWQANLRHGYGRSKNLDGSRYLGEWHNDNRQGLGRASYADGGFHDGAWESDVALGPGSRQDASGIEITGVWNGDLVTSGLVRLPDGSEYAGPLFRRRNTNVHQRLVLWLQQQADTGNPHAHLLLGTVYSDYQQPAPDPQRARRHFAAAAEASVAEAQYRLATLELDSQPDQAIRLLAAAAAAGHDAASALLGEHYASGRFVARDTSVAVTYFAQAAERGNLGARNNLAWILATYPDPLIRDGNAAVELILPVALLFENWQHLDTLAAARAETGEFDLAVSNQTRAVALASQNMAAGDVDPEQVATLQARLALYEQGKPYRETGGQQ